MSGDPVVSGAASDPERFVRALNRFDEENSKDPNLEFADGKQWPRELLYAHRLYDWVLHLEPHASEVLLLAARSQHLCRWMIPRSNYEITRAGYLKWRNELKAFHARKAGEILREIGYADEIIQAVQALNLKKNFPRDPESQLQRHPRLDHAAPRTGAYVRAVQRLVDEEWTLGLLRTRDACGRRQRGGRARRTRTAQQRRARCTHQGKRFTPGQSGARHDFRGRRYGAGVAIDLYDKPNMALPASFVTCTS